MTCDSDATKATALAVLVNTEVNTVPVRGFNAALREIQQRGRPLTADVAEQLFDSLGGAAGLADRISADLKSLRGEGIPDELAAFHQTDYKTLKNMYELIVRVATSRDDLVQSSSDLLDGLTEQDLMVAASQASLQVLKHDPEFRQKVLDELVAVDPQGVVDAAMRAIDLIESGNHG